jgi:transposase
MLSIPNWLESSVSRIGSITMQELDRAKVIEAYAKGEIKTAVAALRLNLSATQVSRLRTRFTEAGVAGMISGHRGKPSNNQLEPDVAQKALQLVHENYADFGPTLACEMLRERHKVVLSKETLRRLMTEAGLWLPRSERRAALHQPRERRASFGELVQIDGSRHAWFEQRGPVCALLVYVDDATGRVLHLHFAETESTASYFEATRQYLERHGKPLAFYADRAAVFRSPSANRHSPTQFQRALDELGIDLICANSPQAKGRVERLNRTFQDRLVKIMRTDGINSIEAANAWCHQFIEVYNRRFAVEPRSPLDRHAPLRGKDDLARTLALRDTRKLSPKLTLQHVGKRYLLQDEPGLRSLVGQMIAIHTYRDGRVELRANDMELPHKVFESPVRIPPTEVDGKTLHHAVDKVAMKKQPRARPYRKNQPAAAVSQGVTAAKKMSAEKRLRST